MAGNDGELTVVHVETLMVSEKLNVIKGFNDARGRIEEAGHHFSAWLASLTNTYSDGLYDHKKFLGELGDQLNRPYDFLLIAGMSFFPGALGSFVGELVKVRLGKKLFPDAPAAVAAAAGGTGDVIKGELRSQEMLGFPTSKYGPAPEFVPSYEDPLNWKNLIEAGVQDTLAQLDKQLNDWAEKYRGDRPLRTPDPLVFIKQRLKNMPLTPPDIPANVLQKLGMTNLHIPKRKLGTIDLLSLSSNTGVTRDDFAAGFLRVWLKYDGVSAVNRMLTTFTYDGVYKRKGSLKDKILSQCKKLHVPVSLVDPLEHAVRENQRAYWDAVDEAEEGTMR